jgi:hypothetical protein
LWLDLPELAGWKPACLIGDRTSLLLDDRTALVQ